MVRDALSRSRMFPGVVGPTEINTRSKPTAGGGELAGYSPWKASGNLKGTVMKILRDEKGKVGWILLWALGVPIPILVILFLVRGCT